jgi:hypothetical protein
MPISHIAFVVWVILDIMGTGFPLSTHSPVVGVMRGFMDGHRLAHLAGCYRVTNKFKYLRLSMNTWCNMERKCRA